MSNAQKLRDMLDIAQDEMVMRDRIAGILAEGAKTIPDLADSLGCPTREVTIWLFGMRRYGLVEEIGRADADGYFRYELTKRRAS